VTGTGVGSGDPASDGTVNFKADGTTITGCGAKAVDALGKATCATAALTVAVSAHVITAEYGSAANFADSNGTLTGGQTVNKRATSTAVATSGTPSTFGESVTFTATVTGTGAGSGNPNIDGNVTFKDGGTTLCSNVAVNAGGVATCSTAALTVAGSPHAITAYYANGANFANSSGTLSPGQTVNKRDTSTAVSSSMNLSTFGQSVTFTATVTGTGAGSGNPNIDGNVTFKDGGTTLCSNVAVNAGGVATCSTPALTVNGGSAHVITAEYGSAANFNGSTGTLLSGQKVNPAVATPGVTVSPTSVQYSDLVTFTATLSPDQILGVAPATSVTFYVGDPSSGGQNMGSCNLVPSGGVLSCSVSNVPLLEPSYPPPVAKNMGPGVHPVYAVFGGVNPNFTVGTPTTTTLTITKEDARATYTGTTFAWTSSSSTTTASVVLSATVQDITAVGLGDPAYDAYGGDIRNATVQFVNRDAGGLVLCTASLALVSAADTKTAIASCSATVSTGSGGSSSDSIAVGIVVDGYYTRPAVEDTMLTVSLPLATNFITGGGYVVTNSSAGTYASEPGSKNNFGFNVKYNKAGTNLQGKVNIIVRSVLGKTYQIKSNAIDSLGITDANGNPTCSNPTLAAPCKAQFNSKVNITDVTNPLLPVSVASGAVLQMLLVDTGEPGTADAFGVTVTGGTTLYYSSNWSGTPPKTTAQPIGGGNLAVH
jgi:hypothetical protein